MDRIDILRTINVQGHELDIYGSANEPLFLAVDVARMLDYSVGNTDQMLRNVDLNEKVLLNVSTPYNVRNGGKHNTQKWFLTEYGLYEVLMQSRKPIARRFKSAVKDILRDLRMKGQGDFEDWLNHEDPMVLEWKEINQQRAIAQMDELTWEDFLRSKGYTEDML